MIRIIFRVTHQYNSRLRNKDYLQVAAPKTANLQEHWIRAPLHSKKKNGLNIIHDHGWKLDDEKVF